MDIKSEIGGSANSYHWFKDGAPLSSDTGPNLLINDLSATQAGNYYSTITSAVVTYLTLQRNPVQLEVRVIHTAHL